MGWSWESNPDVVEMASCRFGSGKETQETRVVADGVEGVSGVRVRRLTAEQIGRCASIPGRDCRR